MSLIDQYQTMIENGDIEEDLAQCELLKRLEDLRQEISIHHHQQKTSWFSSLFGKSNKRSEIKGYYIWGEVGRGKSMLMDLFFDNIDIVHKRRVHFHEFMQEVHEKIHAHRQAYKAGRTKIEDPIKPVAQDLIKQASILCFDEFVVRDIADAMILSRLFHQLFDHGLIVLATSNVAPDALYKDGLNRALFLPFIQLLLEQTHVYHLDSRTDFRLEKLTEQERYLTPLNKSTEGKIEKLWQSIISQEKTTKRQIRSINNKGRKIDVANNHNGIVKLSFDELCNRALGASDYLALSKKFHTFIIYNIPIMKIENRNEAKRFITLIDTLYDQQKKIIISAAAQPENLYQAKSGDEAFEFARTKSRIHEMNSKDYNN